MNSIFNIYMRDIGRYRPLSAEEEHNLALRARQGDMQARRQLIEANLLLVVNIAQQYIRPDTQLMDLIQEGNIGLIKTVDMFDPAQGTRLGTLARFWVEKYILRFLRNEQEELVSLDMEVVDSGETLLLSETIEDRGTIMGDQSFQRIDTAMENAELQQQLTTLLDQLSPNEQQVLELLYGLKGYPCMTREEVSKVLYIQESQISRIKTRALNRLAEALGR